MKLNHDCVRGVLLAVEELSRLDERNRFVRLSVEVIAQSDYVGVAFPDSDVRYAIMKLHEANLLDCQVVSAMGGRDISVESLTFEGHQYLDSIRDETVWKGIKKSIAKAGGSLAFATIQQLGLKAIQGLVGL